MGDGLKFIVNELNQPPFSRNLNLISFDSLHSEALLQVLTDVLGQIDESNNIDIRVEEPSHTVVRILGMLRILKYRPSDDVTPAAFRQGLVHGDKKIIHPILEWLLEHMPDLKKRAYLSHYLVKVEVPVEFMGDMDVSTLYEKYDRLIEEFKLIHKECDTLRNNAYSIAELRTDIDAMEREKDIVLKKVDCMRRKIEGLANKEAMLEATHALNTEKQKSKDLAVQRHDQQAALNQMEQRVLRLQLQLEAMRESAVGATPEGLLLRLEEDTNVAMELVTLKLPKEIQARQKEVNILQLVAGEPTMGRADIGMLKSKINDVLIEINDIEERRLALNNHTDDQLTIFRQQAAIIARKKETVADQSAELKNRVSALDAELLRKSDLLKEHTGETVLRAEDFKRYITGLRDRSTLYKRQRGVFAALTAEAGVLTRTLELLKVRDDDILRKLCARETQCGVRGYRETVERLRATTAEKAAFDREKGKTMEENALLAMEFNQKISICRARISPLVTEIVPIREKYCELTEKYKKAKMTYDATAAGLESAALKLEKDVRCLKEEASSNESIFHHLQAEYIIAEGNSDRLSEELYYVNTHGMDWKLSLREQLINRIDKQEVLSQQLKEEQKLVDESQAFRAKQVMLWSNVHALMECKKKCFEEAKRNSGMVHREKGVEMLGFQ